MGERLGLGEGLGLGNQVAISITWQGSKMGTTPVFILNILNCVPKTNKAFTGLE